MAKSEELAAKLADFVMKQQNPDGTFRTELSKGFAEIIDAHPSETAVFSAFALDYRAGLNIQYTRMPLPNVTDRVTAIATISMLAKNHAQFPVGTQFRLVRADTVVEVEELDYGKLKAN
jgi:hypothetical protein